MDLLQLGAKLLAEKLNLQLDNDTIVTALTTLLGDSNGNVDLAGLAAKMASSGQLSNVISSWLGDGQNDPISPENIIGLLGRGSVDTFASQVGTSSNQAASGLADVLPMIMDKASSGGSLIEAAGGLGGLLGTAKSLLG